MNIIQDIIEKNVKIEEKDFTERRNLNEIVQNQRKKLEELSAELEKQKELLQQDQKNYIIYNNKLENKSFSIIMKVFEKLYLGAYFKEISSQNKYNYFINIKEISNNYFTQGYILLKVTALQIRSSNLYFEDKEYRFYDVADFKKFFEDYRLLQEPELTKIATYMLLSSNLLSECK